MDKIDFRGWATKHNTKCIDGRIISKEAFKHNDGRKVPLVWSHRHDDPKYILGSATLQHKEEGVYADCSFNDSDMASYAKKVVKHGDVVALSIFATQITQQESDVIHGEIREVSLVLSGANPGAYIESVIRHSAIEEDEIGILVSFTDKLEVVEHSELKDIPEKPDLKKLAESLPDETITHAEDDKKEEKRPSVQAVLATMNDDQKMATAMLVEDALQTDLEDDDDDDTLEQSENTKGDETMKFNMFDAKNNEGKTLSHSELTAVLDDFKSSGSLKETFIKHGITDIDYLFPEAHNLNPEPNFITDDMTWVGMLMGAVTRIPYGRIKTQDADITADAARAKGYLKGEEKQEEFFSLMRRETTPQFIYKFQKLDKEDIIDIIDFDVIAWLKREMRMKLDEEIARAVLIGDGRLASDNDKIKEDKVRPIWTDADLYTIKTRVDLAADASEDVEAEAFIRASRKARKNYKGSGSPWLFASEEMITKCLLTVDGIGRLKYEDESALAKACRVARVVSVPVMEGVNRTADSTLYDLMGLIVNPKDYTVGTNKGGEVKTYNQFDIDVNKEKYLIETRMCGALTKPYSAIAVESVRAAAPEAPAAG